MSLAAEYTGIAFEDVAEAASMLDTILLVGPEGFSAALAKELGQKANASRTLRRLRQYLDRCAHPAEEIDRAMREARYLEMLCTLFDQSQFLTDIVCNDPEILHWAWSTIGLHQERDAAEKKVEQLRTKSPKKMFFIQPIKEDVPDAPVEAEAVK